MNSDFRASDLKIAFVQDALPYWGGAEKLLATALEVFPQAPVYTLLYNRDAFLNTVFEDHPILVSVLDHIPGVHRRHQLYLPLMPFAIRQFDLGSFDIVISFSYAVAHAVPIFPNQLHISYIHTPMRYAWRGQRLPESLYIKGKLPHWIANQLLCLFRKWDRAMLQQTDHFVTSSRWMAHCIQDIYQRKAQVLYPPVDTGRYLSLNTRDPAYIFVGRLAAHKRVDLVIRAFTDLGYPLLIIGKGPEKDRLESMAGPNIQFLGWQSEERLAELLGRAKAFVHAGLEDFGIAMVEAQAAGCPVIAYQRGGADEIVLNGKTGMLFPEQDTSSLGSAVQAFERDGVSFTSQQIRASARRFDKECFKQGFLNLVREKWVSFAGRSI